MAALALGCGRLSFDPLGDGGDDVATGDAGSGNDSGSTGGDAYTPIASHGHFVEVQITTGMNLGGIVGADNYCLTTLTNGTWLGKTEAVTAGQLTAERVNAWLCTIDGCQNMRPSLPYRYSSAVNTTRGGAMFMSNAMGYLANDGRAFSEDTVFGGDAGFADYFTGRTTNNLPQTTTCMDWSVTTGMTFVAVNDTPFYPEKLSKYSERCDFVSHIICYVDP